MKNIFEFILFAAVTVMTANCVCGSIRPLPPPPPVKKPCNCFYKRYNGRY